MNVPKGNAVALQALKPIENKTADILSGYVFASHSFTVSTA